MVQVADFGAQGDGITDDSPALEHALHEGDGVLRLHKGAFRLSRPLVLNLDQTGPVAILGDGGTTRLIMTGPGPAIQVIGSHRGTSVPSSVSETVGTRERFPTLAGFEIHGNHDEAFGIELRRTFQPVISQMLVRNCRDGIRLVERNRNVLITDCHLYNNSRYGIVFDRCDLHQVNVSGCHISFNRRAGIRSQGGDVHNIQITGNDIEYNNRPGLDTPTEGGAEIDFDADDGAISEVTLSGNTIQATIQPGGANVRIRGSVDGKSQGACLITVNGNVLGSNQRGIDLDHAYRVAITGNTLYDAGEFSMVARHCQGLSLGSNTVCWKAEETRRRDGLLFEDCQLVTVSGLAAEWLCSGEETGGAGVMFHRCRDVNCSGSQILNPLFAGLELKDCQRCVISGNSIVDARDPAQMPHAIRLGGGNRDVWIQHNLLRGARLAAMIGPRDGVFVRN